MSGPETGYITEEDWKDPSLEGVLSKRGSKGHIRKKWTVRYFRLKNGSLFWFKNKTTKTCKGHIPLDRAVITTNSDKTNRWPNCFLLHSKVLDRSFYLSGESPEVIAQWIQAIKQQTSQGSIVTQSTTNQSKAQRLSEEDDFPAEEEYISDSEEPRDASTAAANDRPETRPTTASVSGTAPKKPVEANLIDLESDDSE